MTFSRRTLLKTLGVGTASLALPTLSTMAQAAPAGPAPVLHQFGLGDATITALLDGHLPVLSHDVHRI